MKKIKDFISYCQLRRRQKEEAKFLNLFVYYSLKFVPMSIMDITLVFPGYFSPETVDAVAEKLSYKCLVFHDEDKKATYVIFHEKNDWHYIYGDGCAVPIFFL